MYHLVQSFLCVRLFGLDVGRQIGYVGQEPVLFAGTIGVNIANGKEGATEDQSQS